MSVYLSTDSPDLAMLVEKESAVSREPPMGYFFTSLVEDCHTTVIFRPEATSEIDAFCSQYSIDAQVVRAYLKQRIARRTTHHA